MKRLITYFMLLTGFCYAAPVHPPSSCFQGWPWPTNQPWRQLDTNYHIVKQITLSLDDRCRAVGQPSLPYLNKQYIIPTYKKTDYTYTNWMYWTPSTNIFANTNQCITNFNPSIQLYYTTNFINMYGPVDLNIPDANSAATSTVLFPVVSRDMLKSWENAFSYAYPYYVPVGLDLNAFSTSSLSTRATMPTYIFGQLLIDSDVGTVYNKQYDSDYPEIMTNCDWTWTNALPGFRSSSRTQTIDIAADSSNSLITVKGLNDLAAMIAQLSKVQISAEPCGPSYQEAYSAAGWYGYVESKPVNVDTVKNKYNYYSFGWAASSADANWYNTFTFTNSFSNSTVIGWAVTNHNDWTNNGWFGTVFVGFQWNGTRTNNIGTNWYAEFLGEYKYDQLGASISIIGTSSVAVTQSLLSDGWYQGETEFVSTWASNGASFLTEKAAGETYNFNGTSTNVTEDTSVWTQKVEDVVEIEYNKYIPPSSQDYIQYGNYYKRYHYEGQAMGFEQQTIYVTNTITTTGRYETAISTNTITKNEIVTAMYTNYVVTPILEGQYETNTWIVERYGDGKTNQECFGTVSGSGSDYINGVMWTKNMNSIRTAPNSFYTNVTGEGYLYIIGCQPGSKYAHQPMGGGGDWGKFDFSLSNDNEKAIFSGCETNAFTTNSWTKIFKWSNVANSMIKDDNNIPTLLWSNLYLRAKEGYVPYYEEPNLTRKYWAIGNAFFAIQYAFTNRY